MMEWATFITVIVQILIALAILGVVAFVGSAAVVGVRQKINEEKKN